MKEELGRRKRFLIPLDQACGLEKKLGGLLRKDPHNGRDGYRVRSFYFDFRDRQDLRRDAKEAPKQETLRLKVYDPADSFAFLELEQRKGELYRKRRMRITRETGEALLKGEYGGLYRYGESFAAECEALLQMRPPYAGAILESRRLAYFMGENNVRITLDHDLKATFQSRELFAPRLSQIYASAPDMVILKVESSSVLPEPLQELWEEAFPLL